MKCKTRQTLKTFVEKANKLKRLKFAEHVKDTGFGFHTKAVDQNLMEIVFDQVDEKELDAALLTFRLFIQQNEPLSFSRLGKILNDPGLSESFKSEIQRTLQSYHAYLAGYPENIKPGFFEEDKHPTRNDILQVVLYGSRAHTNNPKRRDKFLHWTREEIGENVLLQVFVRTVFSILGLIYHVADLIQKEFLHPSGINTK